MEHGSERRGNATGWAAPDSGASQPVVADPAHPGVSSPEAPVSSRRRHSARVLQRLQPMTLADILDGAFAVLKTRPRIVLGLSAMIVLPLQLVVSLAAYQADPYVSSGSMANVFTDPTVLSTTTSSAFDPLELLVPYLLPALALPLVGVGVSYLVISLYMGRDPTFAEVARVVLRRSWVILVVFPFRFAVEAVSLLIFVLPLLAVMTLCVAIAPVVGVEGAGPVVAVRRSMRLAARRFWPALGLIVLGAIVTFLTQFAIETVPGSLSFVLPGDWVWVGLSATAAVSALVLFPITAAMATLLYLDMRVRTEGLDIELEAIERFDAAV